MEVNRKKDKLFNLINSLSKSEKRYFHLYTKQHIIGAENKYQVLFKSIEKQKQYDEAKISKDFAKKNIKLNISSEKNYLYNLILKSLRSYYSENDDQMKTLQLKMDYLVLLKKELYKEAEQRLNQLNKLCIKTNDSISLFENYFRRNLINNRIGYLPKNEEITEFEAAGDKKLTTISNWKIVFDLCDRLYYLNSKKLNLSNEEQKTYLVHLIQKLERVNFKELDFDGKVYYLSAQNLIGILSNSRTKSEKAQLALLKLVETNSYLIKSNPLRVARIQYNLFTTYSLSGKHKLAAEVIQKIESLRKTANIDQEKIDVNILKAKTTQCLNTLQFDNLNELESMAKSMKLAKRDKSTIYYNLSLGYFILEKFDDMLDWINDIVFYNKTKFREDINSIYVVFGLICHYELQNIAFLDNMTRNSTRKMASKGKQNEFEKLIISFIKKSLNILDKKESLKQLKKLYGNLDQFGFGVDNQIIGFDVIKAWIKSKVENKPLKQALEEISFEEENMLEKRQTSI